MWYWIVPIRSKEVILRDPENFEVKFVGDKKVELVRIIFEKG